MLFIFRLTVVLALRLTVVFNKYLVYVHKFLIILLGFKLDLFILLQSFWRLFARTNFLILAQLPKRFFCTLFHNFFDVTAEVLLYLFIFVTFRSILVNFLFRIIRRVVCIYHLYQFLGADQRRYWIKGSLILS